MEPQGGNDPDSTSSEREARTERRSGAADAPAKRSLIKKGEQKGGTSSIKKHSLYLSKLSRPQRSFKNWALLRLQANQMCFSNQILEVHSVALQGIRSICFSTFICMGCCGNDADMSNYTRY